VGEVDQRLSEALVGSLGGRLGLEAGGAGELGALARRALGPSRAAVSISSTTSRTRASSPDMEWR
jgi:hypothetical protein